LKLERTPLFAEMLSQEAVISVLSLTSLAVGGLKIIVIFVETGVL
jgi:hypothetical protein